MQNVADQKRSTTTIRADLCVIFIHSGTEPIDLAGDIVVARRRGEMSKRSVSAGDIAALLGAFRSSGGKRTADRKNLSRSSHSRSWIGRLLDLTGSC